MKIINQLTLRYLKMNKKRTILTLLCIAVSVIMISCVGISLYSGQQYYADYTVKTTGDYHYTIVDYNKDIIEKVKNDELVDEVYFSSNEGVSVDGYYVQLKNGDARYFEKENYHSLLLEGRLPEQTNEIAISSKYFSNYNLNYKLGDTISLSFSLDSKKTITKQFQIVGTIKSFRSQNFRKQSFEALSYIDLKDPQAYYTMYVHDKNFDNRIFEHTKQLTEDVEELLNQDESSFDLRYNSGYLSSHHIFEKDSQSTIFTVLQLALFILMIIVIISLFIIYQAFQLSLNDRVQYLGMLSSVGATSKQKRRSVYFEGMILSLIAIPLGIMISFVGMTITFLFINQLEAIQIIGVTIKAQISWTYLAFVVIISFITIFISLYLPARKISKISILDALKKEDEIKVKKKSLKTLSCFHITQQLALKNYKRQGRKSKVIVASLVISMFSFISVYTFGKQTMDVVDEANQFSSYDVSLDINDSDMSKIEKILKMNDKVDDFSFISCSYILNIDADTSYLNIPQQQLHKDGHYTQITVFGYDDKKIEEICKMNHITYDKDIVLFHNGPFTYYEEDKDGKVQEKKLLTKFHKMDQNFIKSISYKELYYEDNEQKELISSVELPKNYALIQENPFSYENVRYYNNELYMIVPLQYVFGIEKYTESNNINTYIVSKQHTELTNELKEMGYYPYDYTATVLQNKQIFLIIDIFIYGFVCIMIFFTLLNIMNMMSASIDKRKKEFAMLMSVGMSSYSIQKMIWSECLIYGLKTILYGVPLCLCVEWFFHKIIIQSEIPFTPSVFAYIISFLIIMLVMLLTFQICLNRFKKQNIIESLKDDM